MTHRLPLISDVVLPPGVDDMRERLGGRVGAQRFAEAGELVLVRLAGGARAGVLLTADDSGGYVWLDANEVRRVPRVQVSPLADPPGERLATMSATARTYGDLAEGAEIEFAQREGRWTPGRLVEKCRFGALVVREDGVVLGVGFASLRAPPN